MRFPVLLLASLAGSASAFTAQHHVRFPATLSVKSQTVLMMAPLDESKKYTTADTFSSENSDFSSLARTVSASALLWTASAQTALADSPDWGLFEGRTGSLLHPIMMFLMLGYSVWTAILGFNWRRQRTMGDEISALKKTLPDLQGAKSVSEALAAAKSADSVDQARINALQSSLSVESEIEALQKERKELAAANPRDKHFSQGALLAFLGTAFAIEVRC